MEILAIIFCVVLLVYMGVSYYLQKQTLAYLRLSLMYTNKMLSNKMSLEDYKKIKSELNSGVSKVLRWYMKRKGVDINV